MSLLCRKMPHDSPLTKNEIIMAMANPKGLASMPLIRFMPKSEAMSVGNIMMMVTAVSVRMTVFKC